MSRIPFEERARDSFVSNAKFYKRVFLDYDYLIYSKDFKQKSHYIISAEKKTTHI